MKVGSLIFWRDPQFGCHRFWEVSGIFLGAADQESLIELAPLNYRPGTDAEGEVQDKVLVPECLLRGLVYQAERDGA